MYTMIIADDEAIARKSLELFVRKEFPEIEVVSAAGNGVEMVAQIERLKPDMAIVDINMPGIDGISAIGLLRDKGVKTHFVIHTAYSDFEYVKSALRMKVDGYLLKPGLREESIATLRQVCDNIRREQDESRKSLQMHTFLRTLSPILESEILLSVCSGVPAEKEFQSYCEVNDIRFAGGCVVTLVHGGDTQTNPKELRRLVTEALGTVCDHMMLVLENTLTLFLLLPGTLSAAEASAWAADVADLVAESLYRGVGIRYRIGRGTVCETLAAMPDSYRQSLAALRGETPDGSAGAEGRAGAERDNNPNQQHYVDFALRYIDQHYAEDLSLDLVASKIGISPFYLSRLFKQHRGIAFVEYLTDTRIRRATAFARETELSAAEIAARCGYQNISYFYKVFKKATGLTIGEYRKSR